MRSLIVLTMTMLVLAGCVDGDHGNAREGGAYDSTTAGSADEAPSGHAMTGDNATGQLPLGHYMHDCVQAFVIFHPQLDALRAHLPDGFEPIPAAEQWSKILPTPRIPTAADLTDRGFMTVELHGCAAEAGQEPHVDVNVEIMVQEDARDEGLPAATVLMAELARAGSGSMFMAHWEALGGVPFGDDIRYGYGSDGAFWSGWAEVRDEGELVASFSIDTVPENPGEVPSAHARTWAVLPSGTLRADWDALTDNEPIGRTYVGGLPPECSFADHLAIADILGATDCAGARAAGIPTIGMVIDVHDMDMTWEVA